jgi:hypothetical protein
MRRFRSSLAGLLLSSSPPVGELCDNRRKPSELVHSSHLAFSFAVRLRLADELVGGLIGSDGAGAAFRHERHPVF